MFGHGLEIALAAALDAYRAAGWQEWHGGKCPVEPGTTVEVAYGDGLLKEAEAQFLDWVAPVRGNRHHGLSGPVQGWGDVVTWFTPEGMALAAIAVALAVALMIAVDIAGGGNGEE
jgi:hypothetical protein